MKNTKLQNPSLRRRKGFTLIELIVVIAIIGILVAIAIPRLTGFTNRADQAATEAEARTVLTAISALYALDIAPATIMTYTAGSAEITNLTGPLNGAIAGLNVTAAGEIDFTYTIGTHVSTVTDNVIVSTT